MTMKSTFCTLALVLINFLPALAQPADTDPAFGEIIDVRVINLEVVVTDRKERVMGLTTDDFRLLIDGQEVPIEYFTEVVGGQAVAPSAKYSIGTSSPLLVRAASSTVVPMTLASPVCMNRAIPLRCAS